jgi:hypothetical protein
MVSHSSSYPGGNVLSIWRHSDLGNSHRRWVRRRRGGRVPDTKPMGDALRHACRSPRCVGLHPRTDFRCVSCPLPPFDNRLSVNRVPLIAFCILVMETHNDFVRFHGASARLCSLCRSTESKSYIAYQSALLSTPLLLLRILASLVQLPSLLRTLLTLLLISSISFMAYVPSEYFMKFC